MSEIDFEAQELTEEESVESQKESTENKELQEVNDEISVATEETKAPDEASFEEEETGAIGNNAIKILQNDVAALSDGIAALSKLFETKILHSEHEKKIVDKMHSELQRYKEDMYSQLVRPILLDIIEIRDSILRIALAHHNKPEGGQSIPLETFEMYAFDAQEILEKNNTDIFKSDANADFVPIRHRVIKKIPTTDQTLHGKVAESLSDGYNYIGKTISPEKIAVYYYEPPQTKPESNNEEENQNA